MTKTLESRARGEFVSEPRHASEKRVARDSSLLGLSRTQFSASLSVGNQLEVASNSEDEYMFDSVERGEYEPCFRFATY